MSRVLEDAFVDLLTDFGWKSWETRPSGVCHLDSIWREVAASTETRLNLVK
jgi:hypothetical protein